MARKNRSVPEDVEAERGYIGCRLYGGDDDRVDPVHLFDDGRRALSLAIDMRRGEGDWKQPSSSHPGDMDAAANANAELLAHDVIRARTWPRTDEPRDELRQCLDAAHGNVEMIGHYVDRLLKAYALREAIRIHDARLQAAYDGNIDAAVQGTELSAETAAGDWPDPLPLPTELPEVSRFDLGMLPASFRPWIADVAERIQCPPDYAAVAAMVALAGIVGRRVGIRPKRRDDWIVVPNVWGAVIGRPGLMKTPAINEPLNMLKRLEIEAKERYDAELAGYGAEELVRSVMHDEGKKTIRAALKNGEDARAIAVELLAAEASPPIRRRYLVNDTTVEKLGVILNENPNGVVIYRDELAGLLHSLDKEGQEGARAFYLEAWNGNGRYTYDRIGRGTLDIDAAIVSIIGAIQPGPLAAYLRAAVKGEAGDDGLMQRFQLAVWPDCPATWRNVDRWPDTEAKGKAFQTIEVLHSLDPVSVGATTDDGQIPCLRFGDEAQDRFDEWRTELERELRTGELPPALESHFAKYRSLIPSLALLIHLADGPFGSVSISALERAIHWGAYLRSHAQRIFSPAVAGNTNAAKALAARIVDGSLQDGFSVREVYRKEWSGVSTKDDAEAAVEMLIDLDWLKAREIPTGGRKLIVYRINPKVHAAASR